jgi:hypothetical protein
MSPLLRSRRRLAALLATAATLAATSLLAATPAQAADPSPAECPVAITFRVDAQYAMGFLAEVTLKNVTSTPISPPWTITWRFTDGQVLQSSFNALFSQQGAVVTVHSAVYYPILQPGVTGYLPFGFEASGQGLGHPPADVTFNGASCAISFS